MPDPVCLYWTAAAKGAALGGIVVWMIMVILKARAEDTYEEALADMQDKIDSMERGLARYYMEKDGYTE